MFFSKKKCIQNYIVFTVDSISEPMNFMLYTDDTVFSVMKVEILVLRFAKVHDDAVT